MPNYGRYHTQHCGCCCMFQFFFSFVCNFHETSFTNWIICEDTTYSVRKSSNHLPPICLHSTWMQCDAIMQYIFHRLNITAAVDAIHSINLPHFTHLHLNRRIFVPVFRFVLRSRFSYVWLRKRFSGSVCGILRLIYQNVCRILILVDFLSFVDLFMLSTFGYIFGCDLSTRFNK